eukprot:PhM_4_TR15620/c2_g1_i3/m.66288
MTSLPLKHDLPYNTVAVNQTVRFDDVRHGHDAVDNGLEGPRLKRRVARLREARHQVSLVLRRARPQSAARELDALAEQGHDAEVGHRRTTHERQNDDAAVDAEDLNVLVEVRPEDWIDDEVNCLLFRRLELLEELRGKVLAALLTLVRNSDGTQALAHGSLIGAARNIRRGAEQLAQLYGRRADTAGTCMDEDVVTALCTPTVVLRDQTLVGRQEHLWDRGGRRKVDAFGDGHNLTARDDSVLCITTTIQQRHDLGADAEVGHTGPHSDDHTAELEPQDRGSARRRGIAALTLHRVGTVNGCGVHFHDHVVVVFNFGCWHCADRESVGPTRGGLHDGLHLSRDYKSSHF